MATEGKIPMLGFKAGAIKFTALFGYSTNPAPPATTIPGFITRGGGATTMLTRGGGTGAPITRGGGSTTSLPRGGGRIGGD